MWWKIYFWINLALSVIGIFALLQYFPLGLLDIIGLLLGITILFATYSYVFRKKYFQANTWKIIFWIMIFFFAEELLELFVLPKDFISNLAPFLKSNIPLNMGDSLFSWLFSLPGIFAIYKLSQKK